MASFFMKVINQNTERLITACDEEIINIPLMSHGVKICATPRFYGNELVTESELLVEIKNCTSANVIGASVIELLLKNRMIHKDAILWLEHSEDKKKKVGHAIVIK
jgi:hypothetical protein